VQFLNPDLRVSDLYRCLRSIRSGWLAPGDNAVKFEEKFASYLSADRAYLTSSATASIEIALLLAGVSSGDEVICPSITWVSVATSIIWLGATPIFCDVDRNSYLINSSSIESVITTKTKAIVVTHLYGQMVDMEDVVRTAKKFNIKVIEDAAHAIESEREGIRPGTLSFAACFSFHAAKNITSGQGGALIIDSPEEDVKLARRCGVFNDENDERVMKAFGGKFDLTDFQGALLIGQLERIEKIHKKRQNIFEFYESLCDSLELKYPSRRKQDKHGFHQFTFEVSPKYRRLIRRELLELGISTSVHFRAIHLEPFFNNKSHPVLPNAETIGASAISLPTYPRLSYLDLKYIAKQLECVLRGINKSI